MATAAARLQIVRDAIDKLVSGEAVAEYSIGGKSLKRFSLFQLNQLELRLAKEVEDDTAATAKGGRRNFVTFGRPR